MAFPSSPVNNQVAIVNNISYTYNSSITAWVRNYSSGNVTVGNILATGFYWAGNSAIFGYGNIQAQQYLGSVTGIQYGLNAGTSQGADAVAVGANAGTTQGNYGVSIGWYAGNNQSSYAVAVGANAGQSGQGSTAVAIGQNAGNYNQSSGAVAIGINAGENSQGTNSIAIGKGAGLGTTNAQASNSIIINATGNEVDGVASQTNSFYVTPMRNVAATGGILQYNTSTYEITYSNVINTSSTVTVSNTTTATSTATGALTVSGGIGVVGNIVVGGTYYDGSNTQFYIKPSSASNIGALTLNGSVNNNPALFNIIGSATSTTFNWGSWIGASNMASGANLINLTGVAQSANNSGYFGFNYAGGAGSASNFATIGLYASDNILNITGNRTVGVNTTTPAGRLSVNTGASGTFVTTPGNVGAWDATVSLFGNAGSTTGAAVGIGMTSSGGYISSLAPSVAWQPMYYQALNHNWYYGTTQLATLSSTGTFTAVGDIIAYSDRRVKTNIKTIENALSKVLQLRGVTYDRVNGNVTVRRMGLVAQEALKIIPEVVDGSEDTMYGVAYGNTVGLLVEAIKEQQQQIDELKQELKKYKS